MYRSSLKLCLANRKHAAFVISSQLHSSIFLADPILFNFSGSNMSISETYLSRMNLSDNRSASPSCSAVFTNTTPATSPMNVSKTGRGTPRRVFGTTSEFDFDKIKFYELYNLIRNHKDERGRELSLPFLQLPSKFVSFKPINTTFK